MSYVYTHGPQPAPCGGDRSWPVFPFQKEFALQSLLALQGIFIRERFQSVKMYRLEIITDKDFVNCE